jgi:alkylhydroperoxidase family enzyme
MRLSNPRIQPVDLEHLTDDQREALAPFLKDVNGPILTGGRVLNIFRTLAHAPAALTRFNLWGGYILSRRNSLSERDRELVILRTGFNCRSGYEFVQHTRIGLACGLTADEIERIKQGPDADEWCDRDRAMLRATDDLTRDFFVSEASWSALNDLTEKQKMDLVMTVGQYTQVSMILNSFGVQLDEGQVLPPELDGRSS